MHEYKQLFLHKYKADSDVCSVIAIIPHAQNVQLVDGFDLLLLVITNEPTTADNIIHYRIDEKDIQEYRINRKGLQRWMLTGSNRNVMQWVLGGDIWIDEDKMIHSIREEWTLFPSYLRDKKMLIEFSAFLRVYNRCREYLRAGQLIDAYSQVNAMLHHWARIYIIEAGLHPEVMVWRQVYDINPGVYKMYEELQESTETIKQRVELVLLAIDFSIVVRIKDCSRFLLTLIQSRVQPWSVSELMHHPSIEELDVELNLILQELISKQAIVSVIEEDESNSGLFEMKYTVA
jgi:hypothetical protein